MREYRASIIACALVALVVALSFAVVAWLRGTQGTGELMVRVHDGEGGVHEFPLQEDGTHRFETSLGVNVVIIENGSVRMAEADCPNQSCLDQQPLDAPGPQIICLPHKLWVEVTPVGADGAAELDEDLVDWSEPESEPDQGQNPEAYDTVAR